MSETSASARAAAPGPAPDAGAQVIRGRLQDLGGFSVRRLLPQATCRAIGPWVFFDHMGPADFAPGPGIDVRPHPHINLATVTYLFEGEMLHRDSLGTQQAIRPGDINLMIAGRGIVHSEREREVARQQARRLHGLQLWLALPESLEEAEPAFHHYPADALPKTRIDGVPARVMIGKAWEQLSPVPMLSPTLYAEARPAAGQRLALPDGATELGLYVVAGRIRVGDTLVTAHSMLCMLPQPGDALVAVDDSVVAFVGGEALGHRHVWWNFVSSRRERIEQAKADWRDGRFGTVPGDSEEFIPLPED
jgi:redox-sensitive bicupin YhaK (pirin superfamily)